MEKLKKLFNRYTILAAILLSLALFSNHMGWWGLPDYLLITSDETAKQTEPEKIEVPNADPTAVPAKDAGSTGDAGSSDAATEPKESELASE